MPKRETSTEIDEAAAEWALRLDDAGLEDPERAEFEHWLSLDPRRVGAFARAQAVLMHAKRAKALGPEFRPDTFEPLDNQSEWSLPEASASPDTIKIGRRRFLIGGGIAASLAAVMLVLPGRQAVARIYETGQGESRLIPLDGGSTVTLNTGTRIAVSSSGGTSSIRLERGEALFKLAADSAKTMKVEAGSLTMRADRTEFVVCNLKDSSWKVTVCEGQVEVAGSAGAPVRMLTANMLATFGPGNRFEERKTTPAALERELAWQEGMLAFEDTPLGDAAQDFARYSSRRIRIDDAAVAAETVTGRFAANDPEGFARAVALGLDLRVKTNIEGIELTR